MEGEFFYFASSRLSKFMYCYHTKICVVIFHYLLLLVRVYPLAYCGFFFFIQIRLVDFFATIFFVIIMQT